MDYSLRNHPDVINPAFTQIMGTQTMTNSFQVPGLQNQDYNTRPMVAPKKEYDYVYKPGFRPIWDKQSFSQPDFRKKYNLPKLEANQYYQPDMFDSTEYASVKHEQIPHNPEMPQAYLLFQN